MPSYYLQTRGGTPYSTDWDFTRFVPDAILINLGTNGECRGCVEEEEGRGDSTEAGG